MSGVIYYRGLTGEQMLGEEAHGDESGPGQLRTRTGRPPARLKIISGEASPRHVHQEPGLSQY